MPTPLLQASIKRHLPFLTSIEHSLFSASAKEQEATRRTFEIARRMGAQLPESRA